MPQDTHSNEIYPGLWLGDVNALNKKFISDNGISCIINCTMSIPFPKSRQIKHCYRLPVKDNLAPDQIYRMYTMFDYIIDIIVKHLPDERILIHCHAGRQRSVAVIAAFLMKIGDMTKNEAILCIQSKRAVAGVPQVNFDPALSEYEKDLLQLKEQLKKQKSAD